VGGYGVVRQERVLEASKRQRLKYSQRSLLHNFGAKTQVHSSTHVYMCICMYVRMHTPLPCCDSG
jgi:hypothetical protein